MAGVLAPASCCETQSMELLSSPSRGDMFMASAAPLQPLFPALVLPAREGQLEAALWVLKS